MGFQVVELDGQGQLHVFQDPAAFTTMIGIHDVLHSRIQPAQLEMSR